MDIFVTGATGVLGRSVLPLLLERGHQVRALARSDGNIERLRDAGAEPVPGDLFDAASVREAVRGSDAVLHLATKIPPSTRMRFRGSWTENDRIRGLGAKHVVDAALEAGVGTVVYPSFAFVYADAGDRWIDATSGVLDVAWLLDSTIEAEAHVARFAAAGGRGVSLRMGLFYGPESPQTHETLGYARRGFTTMPGDEGAYMPSIWVRDAANAVIHALEAPSGLYDIADDRPLTRAEHAAAVAAAVGRKRLRRPPAIVTRLGAGTPGEVLGRSLRISNRRFKDATGWSPSIPDAQDGWAQLAAG